MAKTVIGLFNDPRQAQHIIHALVDDGFRREDIRTLTRPEGASVGTLSADGVPEAEAQDYAEGLRRGGVVVLVDAADERADRAAAMMERDPAMDLEARTGAEAARGRGRAGTREGETGEITVPVVEEELQVGTRQVRRGGVRLYTRVTERPVEETVRLRDETVHVERRPVDRPATEADFTAAHERTVEVTETDEEPVVRRQARVVEEVVVRKDVEEHPETVRDTVRRTEVEVEPVGAEATREARGFATYEADFRRHYTAAAGSRGQAYEHWAPAYRYGYTLAGDPRYRGRDWAAIEAEARRDWEQQHRGTWEEMKDAIRYAWDRVRGRH
jgi:uncharacterized protein (TIGR02271 family)